MSAYSRLLRNVSNGRIRYCKSRLPLTFTPHLRIGDCCIVRCYSANNNDSFRETLKKVRSEYISRRQEEENSGSEKEKSSTENKEGKSPDGNENKQFNFSNDNLRRLYDSFYSGYDFIVENVKLAYKEMTASSDGSTLERRVHQADTYRKPVKKNEEDLDSEEKETENVRDASSPSAIVLVKDPVSAWEQMKNRLNDSPLIREILKRTKHYTKAAADTNVGKAAQKVGQGFKDKIEDIREFWETSQNPIVYSISGVVESLTSETEEGLATSEIRKLDPHFIKEEWAEDVRINLAPLVIKAHLVGDTIALKPWLGEAVYNKLAADIRARKKDGITIDSNILEIDENAVLIRFLESGGAVIVVVYMVQQINCVRNREGEIIEGGESQIRAKFYSMAFQQQYLEDEGIVKWKVVDYEFAGDIPYF